MKKKELIVSANFVLAAIPVVAQQHPNILYIMSDDHAYNAISAYGCDVSKLLFLP